jgi:hypothetical protein
MTEQNSGIKTISRQKSVISVAITLALAGMLMYFSIEWFDVYGLFLFFGIPLIIGFLPGYIAGKNVELTKGVARNYAFTTLLFAHLAMLVFAIEGIICLVMALPITVAFTFLGLAILSGFHSKSWNKSTISKTLLLLMLMSFFGFDYTSERKPYHVTSELIINAPIEQVWHNVIRFDTIAEPQELLFKTGIAYPIYARIEGNGIGAIRYCTFTTGSFVEPITTWDEPNHLAFSVTEQPIPMTEMNPFADIHPKHLDGYFRSERGEFRLEKLGPNKTRLEGTTWYSLDYSPTFYWSTWCDGIIHKIHLRVLKHIKKESEE